MKEVPCIVCDKQLESVFSEGFDDQVNTPYAGTVFHTSGGYGSTVFDPMNRMESLEVTICDECLVKKNATHVLYRVQTGPDYTYGLYPMKEGGESE